MKQASLAGLPCLFLLTAAPAHAYIDLGTGSYFLQFLLALALGSLVYVKNIWLKLKSMFSRAPKK
jgi:hypothetical protein